MRHTTKQTICHKGKFYTGELPQEVVEALGAHLDRMVKTGAITVILDEAEEKAKAEALEAGAPEGTGAGTQGNVNSQVDSKDKTKKAPVQSKNNFKELRDQVIAHAKANGLAEEDYKEYLKSKDSCMQYLNGI